MNDAKLDMVDDKINESEGNVLQNTTKTNLNILLADDDMDDCDLFNNALEELHINFNLTTVHNGEELMELLNTNQLLPDILFLDLNMPCKNGMECLFEIKQNIKFNALPIVVISTSSQQDLISELYNNGVHDYIRKPNTFAKLKEMVNRSLADTIQTFSTSNREDIVWPSK